MLLVSLIVVAGLMMLFLLEAQDQPSCVRCGGRRRHGPKCPERDR